jgi:hypothetical protein
MYTCLSKEDLYQISGYRHDNLRYLIKIQIANIVDAWKITWYLICKIFTVVIVLGYDAV